MKTKKVSTHKQILNMWPSLDSLVADIKDKKVTVKQWKNRNRIPPDRWVDLVAAAQVRDIALTYKMLAEAAAR